MSGLRRAPLRRLGVLSAASGLGLALAGCASFPREPLPAAQCSAIDWSAVGYEDGAKGRPSTELARHVAACPGLPQEAWAQGRAQGLTVYCTPENGYAAGRAGREYYGVCPAGAAEVFLREYERGLAFRRPAVVYAAPSMSLGWGYGGRGPRWGWGLGWGWSGWGW